MVSTSTTVLLPALLLLLHRSSALQDLGHGLVRRELKRAAQVSRPVSTPSLTCETCEKKDFLLGTEGTNSCRDTTLADARAPEHVVDDVTHCRYAAKTAGASYLHTTFVVSTTVAFKKETASGEVQYTWEAIRPAGCFFQKCPDQPNKDCYYFNEADPKSRGGISDPTLHTPQVATAPDCKTEFCGTPVCQRERYADGAVGGQGGCPNEYSVVMDQTLCEDLCGEAGIETDSSSTCNEEFRIGSKNMSEHNDYPLGCFKYQKTEENAVERIFFNTQSNGVNVTGTPICRVTTPWNFNQQQQAGANADDTTAAAATCATKAADTCGAYTCKAATKEIDTDPAKCATACAGADCDATCCKDKPAGM